MFGLSASHLLILGVIVLLFGGRRLPELGEGLGKGIRAFRAALEGKDLPQQRPQVQQKEAPRVADTSGDDGQSQG